MRYYGGVIAHLPSRLIDEATVLCHALVEFLAGCIALCVNVKAVGIRRETSKPFSRGSQIGLCRVSGSLQNMPTMAILDCAVLRAVVSLGATSEIHGMRLLNKTSRRDILVLKAVFRSLRGKELPKQCSKALEAFLHLTRTTTPRITSIVYVRSSKTTLLDSSTACMTGYCRPVLVD